MAEKRDCAQCGAAFTPRREHARFCSARCRVAWNRANTTAGPATPSALQWSITAMRDTTDRLPWISARDQARALAVIGEAVWWVTIVDATLVRYHPETYDRVLNRRSPAERQLIEETLAGLRFVRNQMGHDVDHADFVHSEPDPARSRDRTASWRWNRLPEPDLASLSPSGQAWEMARYRAYQSQLAGRTVGETFRRATGFLNLAATQAVQPPQTAPAEATGR